MLVLSEDMKFIFQLSEGGGHMYFDGIWVLIQTLEKNFFTFRYCWSRLFLLFPADKILMLLVSLVVDQLENLQWISRVG